MPSRKSAVTQQEKRDLSRLRKRGLYRPKNPRAKPTKYAKQLLKKFRPLLEGKASVVTVPASKKSKGWKAAREASIPETGVHAVRNKLVVPKHAHETVKWDKKAKSFYYTFWSSDHKRHYTYRPLGRRITRPSQIHYPDYKGKIGRGEIQLKPNQRIAIPFSRGRRGIEWATDISNEDDWRAFWGEYKDRGHYTNLGDNLFIFETSGH